LDPVVAAAGAAAIAYLLGSIPSGYLAGRFVAGIDIREEGEGNVGARNVFHEVGPGWGIAVSLLDLGKGAAVALLFHNDPTWQLAVAGAFLVIGHGYPVWLRFQGGKGLAAAGGFAIALMPWAALAGACATAAMWLATRRFLPTLITITVISFLVAPFTGVPWAQIVVAFGAFLVVVVKRILDEPRMRRIEARTGWDRERGGSRR
jgi:glycerol-3-phosphate acyltransferase PlsY